LSVLPHGIVPSASELYKLQHVASIICPDAISDARGLAIAEEPRVSGTLLLSAVRHYTRSQAVARIADRTAKNCKGHVT